MTRSSRKDFISIILVASYDITRCVFIRKHSIIMVTIYLHRYDILHQSVCGNQPVTFISEGHIYIH